MSGVLTKALRAGGLCAALAAGPALAQDRSDRIAEMFGHLPVAAAVPDDVSMQIDFFDVEAGIASMGFAAIGEEVPFLLGRSVPPPVRDYLLLDIEREWPELVGFRPLDLRYGLMTAQPPHGTMIFVLRSDAVKNVGPALLANGYDSVDHPATGTAFSRLADGETALEGRNPSDPFGGWLGMASRVGLRDNVLFQARHWADFDTITAAPDQSLADVPEIATIFAALDDPRFDGLGLVRAVLVTDPSTFASALEFTVTQDRDTDGSGPAVEAMIAANLPRVPIWSTGLIADISSSAAELGVVFMVYGSIHEAEDARDVIIGHWNTTQSAMAMRPFSDILQGSPEFVIAGDEPAALAMILTSPPVEDDVRGPFRNFAYSRLLDIYYSGDMAFIVPQ